MTDPDDDRPHGQRSFWHRRRPGIRLIYSAAAIVGGAVLAVRYAGGIGENTESTWIFIAGVAIVILGLISIPVFRWMDRRRL